MFDVLLAPPIFSFRVSDPTHCRSHRDRGNASGAALRTSEQWRDVFENNPTMCFMLDAQDIVKAVNLFGVEQLGYTVRELVGQPMLGVFLNLIRRRFQRIHPDDQAMITDKIEIARCESGSSSWITESFIPATRSETSSWGAFPFSAHPVNLVEFVGK